MKTLYRILWKEHSRIHLVGAFLGTLAGFVLLLAGMQFYLEFKGILQVNRDLLDPEYIIINKQVGLAQTLGVKGEGFSEAEIRELAAQGFAQRVDPFRATLFPVSAYTDSEHVPDFYTDLFFEAIPDEYIDVKSEDWTWDPDKGDLPIIIPQDYLNLYNFGFAQSQGLPQIPKDLISMVNFRIRLRGEARGQYEDLKGRIVGFSNRINSILVPLDFLTWANAKYGYFEETDPSRVILVSNDPTDPELIRFLDDRGYDTIREKLKSSRLNIILKLLIGFLVLVASIILVLAFLVFVLSLQLMISRSSTQIMRLNKLGFHHREIGRPYVVLLGILLLGVAGFSLGITALLAGKFSALGSSWNLAVSASLHNHIYATAFGLLVLIFAINLLAIRTSTRRLCQ